MNKDESIGLQARQNLYLSDDQVDELIRAKEQFYFKPYPLFGGTPEFTCDV